MDHQLRRKCILIIVVASTTFIVISLASILLYIAHHRMKYYKRLIALHLCFVIRRPASDVRFEAAVDKSCTSTYAGSDVIRVAISCGMKIGVRLILCQCSCSNDSEETTIKWTRQAAVQRVSLAAINHRALDLLFQMRQTKHLWQTPSHPLHPG